MIKGACLIGQSGGPTAVINASLAGIIKAALDSELITNIFGAINGLKGVIDNNIVDLTNLSANDLELLKTTPSACLGSVRYSLNNNEIDCTPYDKLLNTFKKLNVRYFFYIGGNDSMDTCHKIACFLEKVQYECYVIGVPKTIDNDLVITDHSPGYGSAIKYIASTISQIYLDTNSYENGRVTIVEIMGRDAGWLTAGAKLAKLNNHEPDYIYLPEIPFDIDTFIKDVEKAYYLNQKHKALIVVGEGIKTIDGEYLLKYRHFNNADTFGHLQLGGVAQVLCEIVHERLNVPVRSVELNLPQRCSSQLLSKTDLDEAYECGVFALKSATSGHSNKMVIMIRDTSQYFITYDLVSLKDVANKISLVPNIYINQHHNHINDNFITYALPLIQNEVNIPYELGLPKYFKL